MIIRVEIGSRKYQLGAEKNATPDASYLLKILEAPEIVQTANMGDGWEVGHFSCVLDDIDDAIRDAEEIWDGQTITVKAMQEVYALGAWSLVERHRWIGAIDYATVPRKGAFSISATENHGILGLTCPSSAINSTEFPAAATSSCGKPIPVITGEHIIPGGALVAYFVGDGRYLLSANEMQTITGIYSSGVEIPAQYWGHQVDGDRSFIIYTPPIGVEGIPEEITDTIFVNAISLIGSNPVDAIKAVFDDAAGTGVIFAGDSTLAAAMTARGYVSSICAGMADTVGEIVTEFCSNFDCFARIDSSNKIIFAFVDPTPVATLSTVILSASDVPQPHDAVNHCKIEFGWDFPNSKFHEADEYIHASSVTTYGRRNGDLNFFFTRDPVTVYDVTRRYVRQRRQVPRALTLGLNFADQTGINIGDVISVEFETLLYPGAQLYLVKNKRIDYMTEKVTLDCVTYFTGMDYYIKVTRNFDGGTINYMGLVVLEAGDDITLTATPKTDHSLDRIWIDWTTEDTSGLSYTINDIDADHDVQFVFKRDKYRIIAMDDGVCTINPKGDVMVAAAADQSFSVSLPSGKTFSKWLVDGVESTTYPYVFSAVDADHTIVAQSTDIVANKVSLTIVKTGSGAITPRGYDIAGTTVHWREKGDVYLNFVPAAALTRDGVSLGSKSGVKLTVRANTVVEVAF